MPKNQSAPENVSGAQTETPRLVQCRQGVSVFYKEHYLYSSYAPDKLINTIISNLSINSGTLVLIFSPALWLGIDNLISKLDDTCSIAAVEYDSALYQFAAEHIPEKYKSRIPFFSRENSREYIQFVQRGQFRKVLPVDFSAGAAFFKTEYSGLAKLTQTVIDQFWKNRLTLIRFGRLYSKNIFKNLTALKNSIPFENLYNSVEKPIFVCGAGESLDKSIPQIKHRREEFFILAVDAAANSLLTSGIRPDGIVAVESQLAIEKAYIGKPTHSKILLFCDLVGRAHIPEIVNGKTVFFISKYADMKFLDRLESKKILPPVLDPLGSVGLVAMEIALHLRETPDVPVIFSGFDFSYSAGITHAKETPAHKNQLRFSNRLTSLYNMNAAFGEGAFYVDSKNGGKMISTKTLENYALLFSETFSDRKNVFDAGTSGTELHFPKINLENSGETISAARHERLEQTVAALPVQKENISRQKIAAFLTDEKTSLENLRDLFTNGENSKLFDSEKTLSAQIYEYLQSREYLFIHFPDAFGKTNAQSFFNRVRIEVDFFLKEINLALEKICG